MPTLLQRLWRQEEGQDVAEYGVMLAVIMGIAIATIHAVGSNANSAVSLVASKITGN
jgi:Flp pilus assembly pilin Flp